MARHEPPGTLVDVGGRRLHAWSEGAGEPAVVVDAGMGSFSADWSLVRPELSRDALVLTWDRAGYGWSEPATGPRTAEDALTDLRALLAALPIAPPYVLVGHSYGGFTVRLFAARFPDEVAGMVLVDAGHEDWFSDRFPPESSEIVSSRTRSTSASARPRGSR